jgi:hypothetical protein
MTQIFQTDILNMLKQVSNNEISENYILTVIFVPLECWYGTWSQLIVTYMPLCRQQYEAKKLVTYYQTLKHPHRCIPVAGVDTNLLVTNTQQGPIFTGYNMNSCPGLPYQLIATEKIKSGQVVEEEEAPLFSVVTVNLTQHYG